MNTKKCTQCGISKTTSEFGKNKSNPDGQQYWCKVCFASYHKDHAKGIRRTPPPPPAGLKKCTRCEILKSVGEFSKASREADGLQDNCRACNREVSAVLRAANPEKERKRHAIYHIENKDQIAARISRWQKANPEKVRAGGRRFYANNRDKELVRQSLWRVNNREVASSLSAKWRAANIERCRATNREYIKLNRAKVNAKTVKRKTRLMRALPAWADHEKIADFYAEAQRLSIETGIQHHVDHIVPLQSKVVCGLHCEANLQVLTESENSKKNNKFPDVWECFDFKSRSA